MVHHPTSQFVDWSSGALVYISTLRQAQARGGAGEGAGLRSCSTDASRGSSASPWRHDHAGIGPARIRATWVLA